MFVYTLKLNPNQNQAHQLEKRFRMTQHIYKRTLGEIIKRTKKQQKDLLYKKAYKLPKGKERNQILKELDTKYDLKGQFTFSKYANDFRNTQGYAPYIPSDVAGKLGIRAWETYSKVKFAKGAKKINFHSDLTSFEAKGDAAITIRNGVLKMGTKHAKLEIPVIYKNDQYEIKALSSPFKFNRILRRFEFGQWNYYVQMIFDGNPPQKLKKPLDTAVGIDIGTSTIATSSVYQTDLLELAPNIDQKTAEIRRLQRKLDRQRRANNPQNYNEDGTIKKGRKEWHESKRYLKTKTRLNNLKRKQAQQRLLSHKTLANNIVQQGNRIIVEQMSFKGLQAKTKNTEISEKTGKFKRKKRFGKTIAHKAPSLLINQIKYKAEFLGSTFITANTQKVKASQLDHVTGLYNKVGLSTRTKTVDDQLVQRDLYSAFLLQHVEDDGVTVNLKECDTDFDAFIRNQDWTMQHLDTKLLSTGKSKFE